MKTETIVYYNGAYLPKSKVYISPDDRGFLFADGVYEIFRYYFNKFFLFEKHVDRLRYSLQELRIQFQAFDTLQDIAFELLKRNNLADKDAIVYLQITRGTYTRMHQFPPENIPPTVYLTAYPTRYFPDEVAHGVKVITTNDIRWSRCDIKSTALISNILAQQEALDKDATEAIFVKNGLVTEGSHTGFFGIKDHKIITHPKDGKVLPSITRELIITLAHEQNISVKELPIYENQLSSFDELFIVGTSTEITPVVQVNHHIVGNGKPGPITRHLQKAFNNLVRG